MPKSHVFTLHCNIPDTSKETPRLLSQFSAGLRAFQLLLFAFYARQVHLDEVFS
jgi:hypothetical protein